MQLVWPFITLFFSLQVFAYEVDNFTDREILKKDSLAVLDAKVNEILEKAVKGTRKEVGTECNVPILRQEILRWIRPDPTGQLEVWIELTDQLERTRVGIKESIYQKVSFLDSPILRVVGIGRSLLVNKLIVGSDKIGHFFYQGLDYFDQVKNGKTIDQVLKEDHGEDGIWGLSTSGVKSYADMATNYQGYRFWSQLTQGDHSYLECNALEGWKLKRKFTWADYVNEAWDEALNCSEMRPAIQAKVDLVLKERGIQCPIDMTVCSRIAKLDRAQFYTNPKCNAYPTTARKD